MVLRVLVLVLGAVVLVALVDVGRVVEAVTAADPAWLVLAAAANVVSAVAKALTWRGCLAGLPRVGRSLRRGDLVGPFFVGSLVNAGTPARAGDAVRVAMARGVVRRRGGDAGLAEVAGSVVAEHLVSTAVWGALVVCVAPFLPLPTGVRAVAVCIGVGAAGAMLLAGRVRWRPDGHGRFLPRLRAALGEAATAVHHAATAMRAPAALTEIGGWAALQWLGQWVAVWAVLTALDVPEGPLVAASVVVALTLAHALPLTPGGIGTAQAGVALPLVAVGVALPDAVAVGVALQGVETGLNAVAGLGFLLAAQADRSSGAPTRAGAGRTLRRKTARSVSV